MILCGSITDSELRARLLALADSMGWDSWITHETGLLSPMLEALSSPADAIISDDSATLARLSETRAARILVTNASSGAPEVTSGFFVIDVAESDDAIRQHLYNCINTTRLKSRFRESGGREPITRLPRHQELVSALINHRGAPVALLVVQVDHAEHLYANLDPVSRTDLLDALATRLKLAVPGQGMIGFYDAGCFIVVLPKQPADTLMRTADGIRT
ncbi:MAG: hypothetical protein EP301_00525, partial [Gammaproteobacteria bacterium]